MNKRVIDKKSILDLDNNNIEEIIKSEINSNMKRIWDFSFKNSGNNRSSTKTDFLHKFWSEVFKNSFGDYKDILETNYQFIVEKEKVISSNKSGKTHKIKKIIDIFGNAFNVDMLLMKEDKIHTVFLLKAPLTSMNKNRINSVLNMFGEIDRFFGNPENKDINLVFVNFTPKNTFLIKKKDQESLLMVEEVKYLGLNKDDKNEKPIDKLPKTEDVKKKIHEIHIEYEIIFNGNTNNINKIKTLVDLQNELQNMQVKCGSLLELKSFVEFFMKNEGFI